VPEAGRRRRASGGPRGREARHRGARSAGPLGALLALLTLSATACDEPGPRPVGCGFGASHRVAVAAGALFHDVALARTPEGAAALWSDRSGLYLRRLDGHGAPRGAPRRLGPACPGGVAAEADGAALLVACVRPADRDRGRDGAVALLRVENGTERILGETGPVGAQSVGVDVVNAPGGGVVVGWRDADVFTARARAARLRGGRLEGEGRALSSVGVLASAPSLHVRDGAVWHAWTESWFDRGAPRGHLLVQRGETPPRPSLDVGAVDVRVHLTSDARGPMVALRDRRPRGSRPRAFVGRLDDNLALSERDLHLPGRADGRGGRPMLVPCGEHVFSVATRRSSRQVTMVSLRRLDRDLRPVEDEQQIYEYHARFPQAVGVCVDGRLLLAVGERQSEVQPAPRLRTYELHCGPGVAHERTPGTEGNARGQL
jgi:hypothetical protein